MMPQTGADAMSSLFEFYAMEGPSLSPKITIPFCTLLRLGWPAKLTSHRENDKHLNLMEKKNTDEESTY